MFEVWTNIDVISGGRLIWDVGAGWYGQEYEAYGYDFPSPAQRIGSLEETVEIVTSMWTRPEVLIGGGGEQLTLRVVVRLVLGELLAHMHFQLRRQILESVTQPHGGCVLGLLEPMAPGLNHA